MLIGIQSFLYRNRKRFLITGSIIGGLVFLSKYTEYKLIKWHDRQTNSLIEKQKRRQHYEKIRKTANATALSLSNSAIKIVCDELDTSELLTTLHNKSADKIKIWEELKVLGFARCISTVYTSALIGSLVHSKLMILGGYSFCEKIKINNKEINIKPITHEKYLSHLQNFVEKGIPLIIKKIRRATEFAIKSLKLDTPLSLEQIDCIFRDIILLLNGENSYLDDSIANNFSLFPWSNYIGSNIINDDEIFKKMTEEMLDVIDGEDFCMVIKNLVNHGINHIMDYIAEHFPSVSEEKNAKPMLYTQRFPIITKDTNKELKKILDESHIKSRSECFQTYDLMKSSLPVAKLIPILTGLVHSCLSPAPGHLLQFILLNDQLENHSFNIYEAFSVAA